MTSRIKELALMLSSPFFSQEDNFDMKSGGGRTFSGNNAHSDSNSSIMLRTAAKPTATEVEIPDWTDGKVREMMDDYERECAVGRLTGVKATERKQLMLKEIAAHQGQLINELEKIHSEQGERQDTATLLTLWKKKMETWQHEVNSLGDDCYKKYDKQEPCENFNKPYDLHIELCSQNMLPKQLADSLKAEMQACIDATKVSKDKALENLEAAKIPGWESDPLVKKAVEELKENYEMLKNKVESEQSDLDALPPKCVPTLKEESLDLDVPFNGNRKSFRENPDKVLNPILEKLLENPLNKVELHPNTNWAKDINIPDLWGMIGDADTSTELVVIRGESIREWFLDRKVKSEQIVIIINDDNYNTTINVTGTLYSYE